MTQHAAESNLNRKTTRVRGCSAYVSPSERVSQHNESMRQAKVAARVTDQQMVERYGTEGAAHMQLIQQILKKRGGHKTRRIKARTADLEAVHQLELTDSDDDGNTSRNLNRSATSIMHHASA